MNQGWRNEAATGTAGTGRDLVAVATHEFGHAQNINHPTSGEEATMKGTRTNPDNRDLWQYDLVCSVLLAGQRHITPYKISVHQTVFGTPTAIATGPQNVTKAAVGLGWLSSGYSWAGAYNRLTSLSWDESLDGSSTNITPAAVGGASIGTTVLRESGRDRFWYTGALDLPTAYSPSSVKQIRQVYSDNKFVTQSASELRYCFLPTSPTTCFVGADVVLASRGVPAVAWLGSSFDKSVVAWSNMHHDGSGNNFFSNGLRVAVGVMGTNLLGPATAIAARSTVPPGLACAEDFSGNYDCILAYVPIEDMTNRVKVKRFSVDAGTSPTFNITAEAESWFVAEARSANAITAWFSGYDFRFYVAVRSSYLGQNLVVYRATGATATAWDVLGTLATSIATPPVAVSAWRGEDNVIVYGK